MSSAVRRGGRRISINDWRVKLGKRDIFVHEHRSAAEEFLRKYVGPGKPRLVAPNRMRK